MGFRRRISSQIDRLCLDADLDRLISESYDGIRRDNLPEPMMTSAPPVSPSHSPQPSLPEDDHGVDVSHESMDVVNDDGKFWLVAQHSDKIVVSFHLQAQILMARRRIFQSTLFKRSKNNYRGNVGWFLSCRIKNCKS